MISAIAIDDEPPALKIIQSYCDKTDLISLEKSFTQPTEALKYLKNFPCDLLFVDIQMPSITGISLVKAIEQNTMVIFTTAFSEYAVMGYELNAIDYLLKPFSFQRFEQAISKAADYYNYIQKKDYTAEEYVFLRADYSLIKVPMADILYIEGSADYLKVFVRNRKTIVARMTMKEMMEKLSERSFVRVHRSYILPFSRIESVRGTTIFIPEKEIPIGRTYQEEFFERYKPI